MSALLGCQTPRIRLEPKAKWSDGDEACFLATSYGLTPDPWQSLVIVSWLGRKPDGKLASGRCGLSVPRQNGKNGILEAVELFKLVVEGRKILHTAHEIKTARKAFLRLASFFQNKRKYPELAAMVVEIRKTNGQEAIVLNNGGSVEFVARSRGSGRGFTVDDLVCDEAQELTDEQLEALLPTISSAPSGDPQQIFTGTPPGPNSPGEVFTRMRGQGVAGRDKRLSWHEWSVEGNVNITDKALWAQTNPSLGIRLQASVIVDELAAMTPAGFARERLGRWDSDAVLGLIDVEASWKPLAEANPPAQGRVSYAVKFDPAGARVSLAVCLRPESGKAHVEVIDARSTAGGIGWLVDWLVARQANAAQIVVEGKSHAGTLIEALRARKVPERVIWAPTTDQAITAHSMLLNAVEATSMTHWAQPILATAVAHAGKRPIGTNGGWGWKPLGGHDVTPLEAVTYAYWAAMTSKRRPGRKTKGRVMS